MNEFWLYLLAFTVGWSLAWLTELILFKLFFETSKEKQ